ncbi:hypothetical protein [Rubrobacter calidifluminis]|uniref:hypothetical protein n=1 Tax=Rubrobacter calidifluminis TaxID=1392640 RepID=UPI00235F9B74|nr:hypothetical protein [Rubrobacter calidifluminis]
MGERRQAFAHGLGESQARRDRRRWGMSMLEELAATERMFKAEVEELREEL